MTTHLYFDTSIQNHVRFLLEVWSAQAASARSVQQTNGIEIASLSIESERKLRQEIESDETGLILTEVVANILNFPDVIVPFLCKTFRIEPNEYHVSARTFEKILAAAQQSGHTNEKIEWMAVLFTREKEEADKASMQLVRYLAGSTSPQEMLQYAVQHPHAIFYGLQQLEPSIDESRFAEPLVQFLEKFQEVFTDLYGADFSIMIGPGTLAKTAKMTVVGNHTQGLYTQSALMRIRAVIKLLYS